MHKKLIVLAALLLLAAGAFAFSPGVALAGDCGDPAYQESLAGQKECYGSGDGGGEITTIGGLLYALNGLLNAIVPFLVGLAVFLIMWGIFKYLGKAGDEEQRAEAKLFIVWGVVGVFIMVSVWGFVSVLVNTLPLRKTPVPVGSVFPAKN